MQKAGWAGYLAAGWMTFRRSLAHSNLEFHLLMACSWLLGCGLTDIQAFGGTQQFRIPFVDGMFVATWLRAG